MPVRQSGISSVAGMWGAGAGEYVARLIATGRSDADIIRLLGERFPDAGPNSINSLISRVFVGIEAGEQKMNDLNYNPECGRPGLFPNPQLAASYTYLIRIEYSTGGGGREYRTISVPSNSPLSAQELADRAAAAALAMQGNLWESDPKYRSETAEIANAAYVGFETLYIECRS